jgi:hypothetical protein
VVELSFTPPILLLGVVLNRLILRTTLPFLVDFILKKKGFDEITRCQSSRISVHCFLFRALCVLLDENRLKVLPSTSCSTLPFFCNKLSRFLILVMYSIFCVFPITSPEYTVAPTAKRSRNV